jgi:hypothetical protein
MGLRVLLLCALAACVTADRTLQALNQQHLLGAKVRHGQRQAVEPRPALTSADCPQENTRQAFHKWMAQHKKGYANDLKVSSGDLPCRPRAAG